MCVFENPHPASQKEPRVGHNKENNFDYVIDETAELYTKTMPTAVLYARSL
jgi:hypothetical protein